MRQIKKTLIGLADLMRGHAAAPMWWTSAWRIGSPSATILCAGQHEGGRSYKALSIGFLALAFLVGCGDNEPSNSDIKKQLSNQVSPCPELSIVDFRKINGYPQNDGSYIDQVQYNIVFTPSDQMLGYVSDYDNKKNSIESEGAADTSKVQSAIDKINALGCTSTYQSDIQSYNNELFGTWKDGHKVPGALDNLVMGDFIDGERTLDADNDESGQAINLQLIDAITTIVTNDQSSFAAEYSSLVLANSNAKIQAELANDLIALKDVKAKLTKSDNQLSACEGVAQKISQDNQGAYDHVQALKAEMTSAKHEDTVNLVNAMNSDCQIVVVGGVLGMLGFDMDDLEAYGTTHKLAESEIFTSLNPTMGG